MLVIKHISRAWWRLKTFCSPQNISRASQQNSVAACVRKLLLTLTWRRSQHLMHIWNSWCHVWGPADTLKREKSQLGNLKRNPSLTISCKHWTSNVQRLSQRCLLKDKCSHTDVWQINSAFCSPAKKAKLIYEEYDGELHIFSSHFIPRISDVPRTSLLINITAGSRFRGSSAAVVECN